MLCRVCVTCDQGIEQRDMPVERVFLRGCVQRQHANAVHVAFAFVDHVPNVIYASADTDFAVESIIKCVKSIAVLAGDSVTLLVDEV